MQALTLFMIVVVTTFEFLSEGDNGVTGRCFPDGLLISLSCSGQRRWFMLYSLAHEIASSS